MLRLETSLVFASLLLAACGTSATPGTDAGSGADAALDDAGPMEDAAAPVCPVEGPPPTSTSEASVRFEVTGPPGTWIVDMGRHCQPMSISDVRLAEPSVIHCEGPPPPPPSVARAVPAATGATFTWAGTGLLGYVSDCVDCGERYGAGLSPVHTYVETGVGPGRYTAAFVVLDAVPSDCTEAADGTLSCLEPGFGVGGDGTQLCPGRTVVVEVDLPASGEIVVPVDVTPPSP